MLSFARPPAHKMQVPNIRYRTVGLAAGALLGFVALQRASAATHCVNANGTNPVAPYADWPTAATNIQGAVDAATTNDFILVTNGVYEYGGGPAGQPASNRVYISA